MRNIFMGLLVVGCLLDLRTLTAQALTGSLIGTVKDARGNGVEGASVRVTSPSYVVAVAEGVTGADGEFAFGTLSPGRYVLEIQVQGFSPFRDADIVVGVGVTIERKIVLKFEELVVVAGSSLEARSSG